MKSVTTARLRHLSLKTKKGIAQAICWARASRPQMSAKRENRMCQERQDLRDCGAFAGGTPAVPANHFELAGLAFGRCFAFGFNFLSRRRLLSEHHSNLVSLSIIR